MTTHPLERYANDVLAALLIGSFVAFVGVSSLNDVGLGFSGFQRSVFVNGVALVVLVATVWVFGAQTLVAVSNLAKAAFVPGQLAPASRTAAVETSNTDETLHSQSRTTTDGGRNDESPANDVRDPVAGHPRASDRVRRQRMIQSEWPPLDVLLSYVVLTPLVVVLLAPFAEEIVDALGPENVSLVGITIPEGWVVGILVVALVATAIGWRRANGSGVGWLVLGAFLFCTVIASRVGIDEVSDGTGSAPSFELAVEGLTALPDQFFLLYFVLVLVVVVWAFGERAATAVALVRRRTTGE